MSRHRPISSELDMVKDTAREQREALGKGLVHRLHHLETITEMIRPAEENAGCPPAMRGEDQRSEAEFSVTLTPVEDIQPVEDLSAAIDATVADTPTTGAFPLPEPKYDMLELLAGYLPIEALSMLPDIFYGRPHGHSKEHIADLAETIMAIGQEVAVEVVVAANGLYVVTKGSGRMAAMKKLLSEGKTWPNGPAVKVQLATDDNLDARFVAGAQENIHRDNLGPEEMVAVVEYLRKPPFNLRTDQEIADRLKVKRSTITGYSIYARRIPEIRKAVTEGRMSYKGSQHAPKRAEEQLRWLRQMEKKAEKRASGKPKKGKPQPSGKVTASVVSNKRPAIIFRKDLAADFRGIARSYCKDKPPVVGKIIGAVSRYLTDTVTGGELAAEISLLLSKAAKSPGNNKANKGRIAKLSKGVGA